jgi:uncharacterized tellurite resistance protein B-like protein
MEITADIKGHFLRLYQMALTDESFTQEELTMLYRLAEDRNVSKEDLDKLLLEPAIPMSIPESPEDRLHYLYDLGMMIWADGKVHEDELITLKKYCRRFDFLDENIDELAQYILDSVEQNKTFEEILLETK